MGSSMNAQNKIKNGEMKRYALRLRTISRHRGCLRAKALRPLSGGAEFGDSVRVDLHIAQQVVDRDTLVGLVRQLLFLV